MNVLLGISLLFLSDAISAAQDYKCDQELFRQEVQTLTDAGIIVSVGHLKTAGDTLHDLQDRLADVCTTVMRRLRTRACQSPPKP
jgi:hypothetical protein